MTARVAGHFGEWFQGIDPRSGELVAVTVPCPALAARATRISVGAMALEGDARAVRPDGVAELFSALGLEPGTFRLHIDMPPGGGAGASTASLVALAHAAGGRCGNLAAACIAAEGASDPLMHDQPDRILWAPRRGRIVERLSPPPPAVIVGGFWGPAVRTDPADTDFPMVGDLIDLWRSAHRLEDFAKIATASAERTGALRGPAEDPTPELAARAGALGWLRAHTGSARGLVFAPGQMPADAQEMLRAEGFAQVLCFDTGGAA